MTDKEKLRRVSDFVSELDIFHERAQYIQGEMSQEYFELTDPVFINFYHDNARIQCDIALDYICRIGEKIEQARELLKESGTRDVQNTSNQEYIKLIVKLLDGMGNQTLEIIYNYVNRIFVGRGGEK